MTPRPHTDSFGRRTALATVRSATRPGSDVRARSSSQFRDHLTRPDDQPGHVLRNDDMPAAPGYDDKRADSAFADTCQRDVWDRHAHRRVTTQIANSDSP